MGISLLRWEYGLEIVYLEMVAEKLREVNVPGLKLSYFGCVQSTCQNLKFTFF